MKRETSAHAGLMIRIWSNDLQLDALKQTGCHANGMPMTTDLNALTVPLSLEIRRERELSMSFLAQDRPGALPGPSPRVPAPRERLL